MDESRAGDAAGRGPGPGASMGRGGRGGSDGIAGQRRPVDVAAVERELARLWASAGEPAAAAGPGAATRACALNLVVYVESEAAAERVSQDVARAAAHDPCRAIVVVAEPDAPAPGFAAWLSAHCYLPQRDGAPVCCEQVTIAARGSAVERAPGLILPLLVADLPVVLWWTGDPALDAPTFARFVDAADRVVLDSAQFARPRPTLVRLAELAAARFRRAAFGDLNWSRLTPWREAIAQLFDAPELRPCLWRLRSVAVAGSGPASEGQALLLVGWLASRLGWRPAATAAPGQPLRFHDRQGQPVEVALQLTGGAAATGLTSVTLLAAEHPAHPTATLPAVAAVSTADTSGTLATFRVALVEGGCLETRAELAAGSQVRRSGWLHLGDDAGPLCQELEVLGRDRVFEEALALVGAAWGPGEPSPPDWQDG